MQTFVPYPDAHHCSWCLDWRRLGKQRPEVQQIFNALLLRNAIPLPKVVLNPSGKPDKGGWVNHSATRMWSGHEVALLRYGVVVCETWAQRGHEDNLKPEFEDRIQRLLNLGYSSALPPWWGDPRVHQSHRAMLLTKDHAHYSQFGWPEDRPDILSTAAYFWPA